MAERYCKPLHWGDYEKLLKKCKRQAERIKELEQRVELMELIRADWKAQKEAECLSGR